MPIIRSSVNRIRDIALDKYTASTRHIIQKGHYQRNTKYSKQYLTTNTTALSPDSLQYPTNKQGGIWQIKMDCKLLVDPSLLTLFSVHSLHKYAKMVPVSAPLLVTSSLGTQHSDELAGYSKICRDCLSQNNEFAFSPQHETC